ncbi:hypothetical protein BASA50_011355 [Batrachochytrium salamandrivorans]|uniref:Mitochondrial distribution and morphology protein 35 n=1 Tax=Batrachochytrium salamandrivorans TaxID=1357716 RepID=A0ABQ8EVW5_9FUNG|nr:hypothetical protein BASA60_009054 [Batrachochytrium salamandrivorans]KAH6575217.1 hypothetical protein BASA62_002036 [Batrachochytrium salamandrivorans]KAH6583041.1 hypothetical protein BASA61_008206 [Batrachochytrium salamandrivorans]KAH6587468.1 hypothetical protein BASA50_011355 [Batrachochytrium salamandrivorans]KAH9247938.1 hypothetical protein BASA81_014441 [Batrachochytrium salamandrivorans]
MASLSPECDELKQQYDACFNKWYSEKFLKGDRKPSCDAIFQQYRDCVWKAIKNRKLEGLISDAKGPSSSFPPDTTSTPPGDTKNTH